MAKDDGLIFACKAVYLYLFGQPLMRPIILGNDQQAAGILINPMDNARTQHTIDAGKTAAAMRKQCIHQCTAGVAGRWVHHHTLWLVNHQQVCIFVYHIQGDRFGLHGIGDRLRDFHCNGLAATQLVVFGSCCAIDRDQPPFKPLLSLGTADIQVRSNMGIQPLTGLLRSGLPALTAHGGRPSGP